MKIGAVRGQFPKRGGISSPYTDADSLAVLKSLDDGKTTTIPPATPDGSSLLRCSVSAGHTPEQIDTIGNAFADL